MPKDFPPVISNVQVSPASGPGGTLFLASVTASEFPPLKISYQWKLDDADIIGATEAGHIASAAGQLTVLVTATGDFGSDRRESAAVQVSPALAAPVVSEARIVPGSGMIGDRFAALVEATGVPAPELSFQWMLDGVAICGATAATYTAVSPGELGVRVTGRNTEGSGSRNSDAVSLGTVEVAPKVTAVGILPSGGRVGETFTAFAEAVGSPAPELRYQWFHDGTAIAGATGVSHAPGTVGHITVRATATSVAGSDSRESAGVWISPAYAAARVDSVSLLPGSGRVGDTFNATAIVSGLPEPDLKFAWILNDQVIAAATGASYTATGAGTLRVRVVATNSEGEHSGESGTVRVEPAFVAPTITNVSIAPQSGPVGSTFEAAITAVGNPAPELTYQWLRDGAAIAGATGASHVAGAVGVLSVRVTATNSAGSDTLESSVPVLPLIGAPIPDAGPHAWNENEASGVRTFDAAARFSVPGDPAKAGVSYGLMEGGGGGGPFVAGVLDDGVFVGQGGGYVSIDPATGVLGIDTDASGPLDGVTVVVRASNGAGHGDLAITLTVARAEAWSPAALFAAAGSAGACLDARADAMFQEHAGTAGLTPANANQHPIGTVAMTAGSFTPPIYARAINASTGRPRRREEGGAVCIEWDGIGSKGLQSVPLGALETGWHIFAACRSLATTGAGICPMVSVGDNSTVEYMLIGARPDVARAAIQTRSSVTGQTYAQTGTNNTLPANTDVVVAGYLGIGTQKMWVKNALVITAANAWTGTEAIANARLRIDAPFGVQPQGRTYAALAYKPANRAEISPELMAQIYTYLLGRLPS